MAGNKLELTYTHKHLNTPLDFKHVHNLRLFIVFNSYFIPHPTLSQLSQVNY